MAATNPASLATAAGSRAESLPEVAGPGPSPAWTSSLRSAVGGIVDGPTVPRSGDDVDFGSDLVAAIGLDSAPAATPKNRGWPGLNPMSSTTSGGVSR